MLFSGWAGLPHGQLRAWLSCLCSLAMLGTLYNALEARRTPLAMTRETPTIFLPKLPPKPSQSAADLRAAEERQRQEDALRRERERKRQVFCYAATWWNWQKCEGLPAARGQAGKAQAGYT